MSKTFLDKEGFLWTKRPKHKTLTIPLRREVIEFVEFTDEELYEAKGGVLLFDLEIYPNYFLTSFKQYNASMYDSKTLNMIQNKEGKWEQAKIVSFEITYEQTFNLSKLVWVLNNFCLVGFNSAKFDLPILSLALAGASLEVINDAVEQIIKYDALPKDIENKYLIKQCQYNHIDLIEVAPLSASLKTYGGRLHAKRLQELPYPPEQHLTKEQMVEVKTYNINDLDLTGLLLYELSPQLDLRFSMSEEYGVDLRSKSDAQIAEAVICNELKKVLGYYPRKPKFNPNFKVVYTVPDFIKFNHPKLNEILNAISKAEFSLDHLGSPVWPEGLGVKDKKTGKWCFKIQLGDTIYKLGMGGLHSQEESLFHKADKNTIIADNDVESFYPRIILNQNLYPEHLGEAFIEVYNNIVETRLEAKALDKKFKKEGDRAKAKFYKVRADSLKITINGSFGKFGNKYSSLYSPKLLLQVTITGQLVLLMLIEMLTEAGINVISGNTDGIVSKYNKDRHNDVRNIILMWEKQTNFKTEETRYNLVSSRDVNNYYAVKSEGGDTEAKYIDEKLGVKTKGCYSERGSALNSVLSKNPEFLILSDAAMQFLLNNIPLEETIKSCTDIRRFTTLRNVKGGAEQNGIYLGKVVRFYYSTESKNSINYVLTGNKVPKSDNSKPLMDLPLSLPLDINYNKYINMAVDILYDIGYLKRNAQNTLFI